MARAVPLTPPALHPSTSSYRLDRSRALTVIYLMLAAPALGIPIYFAGGVEAEVLIVSGLVLVGLLLVRVHDLARASRRQERRFAALLAAASDAIAVIAPDGTARFMGAAAGHLLGQAAEKTAGGYVLDVIDGADPESAQSRQVLLDVARRPGLTVTRQVKVRHVDGSARWLSVTATNRVDDPAVDGIVLNFHDVTAVREAQDRLRFQAQVLGSIRESVVVSDVEGRVTYWNDAATEVFGYSADEMLGKSLACLYPDAAKTTIASDLEQIATGADYFGEWQGQRKDGSHIWIEAHTSAIRDDAGRLTGFIGVSRDITARRQMDAQLMRLGAAIEQTSDAVVIADSDASIEYVNPAFERITGYSRAEVVGKNPRILNSGIQTHNYYEEMWASLTAGRPWVADFVNRRKDGTLYEESAVIAPIRDGTGNNTGYVAVKRDVTGERRLEQRAQQLAHERALIAGTLRKLDGRDRPESTAEAICRQVVNLSDVAVAGLFTFGHDGRARPLGVVLAGESPPRPRPVPAAHSDYLRQRAQSGPWIEAWVDRPGHPHNEVMMRLGVGAGAYAPVRDGDELIGFLFIGGTADDAAQVFAGNLGALVEFADIAGTLIGPKLAERNEAGAAQRVIRQIISRAEFKICFQPIFDLQSLAVVGYEALTRFDDGVPPDERFAAAGRVGLQKRLELATLRSAIRSAAALPAGAWLNLNVSPMLIGNNGDLAKIIAQADRPVVIEVTEHVAIRDYAAFRRGVERIGSNVRVAVDDAGAGFASLRHILELQPAFVKLDRGLIGGIDTDSQRQALVAGIRHFALVSGCRLIAEGVETDAELETLRRLNVDMAQGYLLARPAPAAAFAAVAA